MPRLHLIIAVFLIAVFLGTFAPAQTSSNRVSAPAAIHEVLFRNVRVFNGTGKLSDATNVLVRGNVIEKISTAAIAVDQGANTVVIDGNGRTLMPGLIDAHTHMMFAGVPLAIAMTADIGYVELVAGQQAERMLMRGSPVHAILAAPASASNARLTKAS